MKLHRIVLFVLMLLVPLSVFGATTRYVATTGDNTNSCTASESVSTPKLTIAQAISCMASGDTLIIKGGTYTNQSIINVPSGTGESTRTVVKGAVGETVTIQARVGDTGIDFDTESYISVENMILDGQNKAAYVGLCLGCNLGLEHHIRIKDVEVHHFYGNGASVFSAQPAGPTRGFHEFINVIVRDCGSLSAGLDTHGFYITSGDSTWDNVTVYNQSVGYGLHFYLPGATVSGNRVKNSRFYNNQYGGTIILFSSDLIIENSVFGPAASGGVAITANGAGIILRNNTFYGATGENGRGIGVDQSPSVSILNNVLVNNAAGGIVLVTGTHTVQNNLASGNTGGNCSGSGCTGSGNLFGSGFDAKFVNAAAADFHLQSGSAAIDSGQTIGALTVDKDKVTRPQGAGYDMGAYEFGSAPPVNQLISNWPATEGTGTVVDDIAAQNNNGTLVNGVSWLTTPTRLSFAAASSQSMSVPQDLMTWMGGTFSLVFDMGTTQVGTSANWWQNPGITGLDSVGNENDIGIVVGNDGKLWVGRGTVTPVKTAIAINDGTERCFAVTVNHLTGLAQVFRANVVDGSGTLDIGVHLGVFTAFGRLTLSSGSPIYYSGTLRRVALYNYILSAAEVTNVCGTPTFDFTVATSGNLTMSQSATVNSTITVSLIAGTAAAVTPSVLSGLPAGVTASFAPTTCTPTGGSCTSVMTLTATAGATVGTTSVIVRGTAGATVRDASAFNLTVNPTVAGATFTQSKFRIGLVDFWIPSLRWQQPVNVNAEIIPGGRVLVWFKVQGEVANPPAVIFDLWASKNGGAYISVPSVCTATSICLSNGPATNLAPISAVVLAAVETTYVTGYLTTQLTAPAAGQAPEVDLSTESEVDMAFVVKIGSDVAPGTDTFDLRLRLRTGQALTSYTVTPRLTVVRPRRIISSGQAFSTQ